MRCPVRQTLLAAVVTCLVAEFSWAGGKDALLGSRELRGGWEVVGEAPVDPSSDPDLVAWGVREQNVRHYTRNLHGRTQVCSVEIWRFASEAQATAAETGFQYPNWQIRRAGDSLIMVRGLVLQPGVAPKREVFRECDSIGARILDRAG